MRQRTILFCLSVILVLSCLPLIGMAASEPAQSSETTTVLGAKTTDTDVISYKKYLSQNVDIPLATKEVSLALNQSLPCVIGSKLSFEVEISSNGLYELQLTYASAKPQNNIIKLGIDDVSPFSEAERLIFPAFWKDAGGGWQDSDGNESAPDQILYQENVTVKAKDYVGQYENPFLFSLTAGKHTITLTVVQGEFILKEVIFVASEQTKKYQKVQNENTVKDAPVVIQGESAALKSERSLIPMADFSNPTIDPIDPLKNKINYIGGKNWSSPCSSLTWDFKVKTSGYYSLGFVYRQNLLLHGVSYRHLMIDGKTPFDEARRIKFTYNSKWKYMDFSDKKDPYLIYLDAGLHTLTLEATPGAMSEIYSDMLDVTGLIGNLYVDITMVVGETVDIYRSYELFNQIPDFNKRLDQVISSLNKIASKLEALQEQDSGSTVSAIRNAVRVVKQMRDNPYSAHRYKSDFYDAYTNLSALMGTMMDTPLDIDRIFIIGDGAKAPKTSPSFLEGSLFGLKRFFATFFSDYNALSTSEGKEESLTIWVNWGRDQTQALNSIINEGFVKDTGIGVNLSMSNASLPQAILTGKGPDCLLDMAQTDPVNFAMRGALYNLSQFEDLPEVLKRFTDDAAVPFRYQGGIYALPSTQTFNMMFMRTDILDSLGIKQPETWDEFIEAGTLLQRNNLQVGVSGASLYTTLLVQNGLSLYNQKQTASTLTDIQSIQVFTNFVGWFTKYKFPIVADFYNRFRVGSMPIGIAPYTLYTQLKAAAPEIDGRWTVAPIPGTRKADGLINSSSAGTSTGCAITKLSKNPKNAWKFLKWWTSAETQLKYSTKLESALGLLGRVASANTETFKAMDWDIKMREQILTQRGNMVMIPEVPGGYYTERGITQAFMGVVQQGKNPTEMMSKWGKEVDSEIARKRAEYIKD